MIGLNHLEQLAKELDLTFEDIREVFRDEIAKFYKVDWVLFTDKQTIVLNKYDRELKQMVQKTIFIQEKKFKTIIKNTIKELYKLTDRNVLSSMKKKLNLKILKGKKEFKSNVITLFFKRYEQWNE